MNVLPSFFVIGAQKAGTTTLRHLLQQHPDVFMCDPKEPLFFSKDEVFEKGWEWYESLFASARHERAIGEASANYYLVETWPHALPRVAEFLPGSKIIFCVRHPIERLESGWKQYLAADHPIPRSFSRAIREYPRLVEGSRYWQSIDKCRRLFGDDNIHLIFFEDLKERPREVLRGVFRFLAVDPLVDIWNAHIVANRSAGKRVLHGWARGLRRVPGRRHVKKRLPWRLRRFARKILLTAPMPEPQWDNGTWEYVVRELSDDTARFLNYAGKPQDYWVFDKQCVNGQAND